MTDDIDIQELNQQLRSLVEHLLAKTQEQQRLIEQLRERITALEAQLNKDSHNSHKPPSSDGLKRKTKSLRVKSTRPSGGQQGHAGTTLKMVAEPDRVVVHAVDQCRKCGRSLKQCPVRSHARRQVFDIPVPRLEATEHRAEQKECPACGTETEASFPASVVKAVQYGNGVKALGVYLMHHQLLPFKRTSELLNDLFGCTLSEGSLQNWAQEAARTLEPFEDAVKQALKQAPVLNADETGSFCETMLRWLHVASTPKLTHYAQHEKRGKEGIDAIGILPHVKGRIIHDCWKSYDQYDQCLHGYCNAHLLRELTGISEQTGQQWAQKLIEHLYHIHKRVMRARTVSASVTPQTLKRYEERFDALVERGFRLNRRNRGAPHRRGRVKQSAARNLLERLRSYRDGILAFMYDDRVPFTNNLAERDLRMVKVKQKISGTFRSRSGAECFYRIRGYISTAKKNAINIFHALLDVFSDNRVIPQLIFAE